jgi:hypothetical protein
LRKGSPPRRTGHAGGISYFEAEALRAALRSAEDAAEDAADAAARAPAVVAVAVAGVLAEALVVAMHEAVAERLRGGFLVEVRPLRVVALPALRVARPGVQAVLVALVHGRLVVAAVAVPAVTISCKDRADE